MRLSGWALSQPGASQVALVVKNPQANAGAAGDGGSILGREDDIQKEMATHSSLLAWEIPGHGVKRVGQDWAPSPGVSQCDWNLRKKRLGHTKRHETATRTKGRKTMGRGGKREAVRRPGERPQKPCSWTSSFQTCVKMNFSCLSYPLCGFLFGSTCDLIQHAC